MWTNYIGVTTRSCAIVPQWDAGRKQFDEAARGECVCAGQDVVGRVAGARSGVSLA
jgi:hypothetical protein